MRLLTIANGSPCKLDGKESCPERMPKKKRLPLAPAKVRDASPTASPPAPRPAAASRGGVGIAEPGVHDILFGRGDQINR